MNERDKIIDKIKKCLALSASSNEHEAAAALRQARKLMEAHNISDAEMLAAGASEHRQRAGAQSMPPNWEAHLAGRIADAFGCRVIFQPAIFLVRPAANWLYIGCGPSPEIAGYAFEVLHRQCKRARAEHIKARLKRCKTATKTRRADLFCEGWVSVVLDKIEAFAGNDAQHDAIEAYVATNFPALRNLNARDRNGDRSLRDHEYGDWLSGRTKGADAELNRGVGGEEQRQIGG
jgi:hypothetical protein